MKRLGEISAVDNFNKHVKICTQCKEASEPLRRPLTLHTRALCVTGVKLLDAAIGYRGGFSVGYDIDKDQKK